MPSKINASVSSGLVVDSDLTGSLKLQTGGNDALSIDSSQVVNFTKQFQIGGVLPPVFSAYRSGNQTISGDTWTKDEFNAESFDTANCFDSTTNYRFIPNVAGYYNFIGVVQSGSTSTYIGSSIYKNGGSVALTWSNNESAMTAVSTAILYMNGSTDFVEVYSHITGGSTKTIAQGIPNTYFQGVLVRAV